MSIQSFTRAGAFALVIAVMTIASACDLVPFNQRVPVPSQPPGPVISQLSGTQAPAGGLPFSVIAADRDNKPLRFTWSASHGTLSATNGATVTWKPLKADGTPEPAGMGQVRVTATNGRETETLSQLVRMDGAGGAVVYVPDNIPPAPTPKPSPSGSATPGATGSPAACTVGKASPTIAAPDTIFYIAGTGLPTDATVTVGGREAIVVEAKPNRLAVRVPGATPVNAGLLEVKVNACGETKTVEGGITVADTVGFGGDVRQVGRGLVGTAYVIDARTETMPADLDGRTPVMSYLTNNLDVGSGEFRLGFPGDPLAYYGIRYLGQVDVKTAGATRFTLTADDGAKLYIDDKLVIDQDGKLGRSTKDGTVTLTAGKHKVQVDYYQGDRNGATLQLFWTPPGAASEVVIPADAFSPLD
ncbi:PA14 domain protein [compost metagenome]